MSKNSFLIFVVVLVSSLHVMSQNVWGQGKPVKVEVVKSGSGYQLFRGGQPYFIKGAGGSSYMSRVAAYGGNSIRTWGTRDGQKVLDSARKYGLTVLMGLGVTAERHGFDYGDTAAVRRQFDRVKADVLKYKDHPSLLAWGSVMS